MEAKSVNAATSGDNNRAIVYFCFCASGFAALVYELSWQRLLLRVLGSTLPAVTLVLCVFMGGLAIGSYVCIRFATRMRRPLLTYAVLEVAVGAFGLLSPWLFDNRPGSLVSAYDAMMTNVFVPSGMDSFEPFNGLFWCRALFASALLLVPTTAIGATFPAVSKYFEHSSSDDKQNAGGAYLVNLVGAALGTICAGFLLMPNFGLTVTVVTASIISLSVALLLSAKYATGVQIIEESAAEADTIQWRRFAPLALAVLLNGAVGMALEVIWSRLFSLLVGSSTYSVASVFAVSIVGLAMGTFVAQRAGNRVISHKNWLGGMCCLVAGCLYLDLWLIQLSPWIINVIHQFFSASSSFAGYLIERLLVISHVVLPASFFCGTIFPLALREVSKHVKKNSLGFLYTFSSIGSVIGAATAGFILVPLLGRMFTSGMESSILLIIFVELCLAIYLFVSTGTRRILIAIPIVLIAPAFFRPEWNKALISSGVPFLSLPSKATATKEIFDRVLSDSQNNKLLFYREGLNTTVTVNANIPQNIVYLKNDGKVEAALPFDLHRSADTSDLTTHFMLGKLPISMNSAPAKKVFVVGLGSGATAGGALAEPSVKSLKVAEIEPTIFEIQHYFEPANGEPTRPGWLESGRVLPFCGDARICLNFSDDKYDVIISQPAEPWISGSADLYTTEFWKIAQSKLNAQGCFCQWIQLYAIDPEFLAVLLRTFQNVFPNTYIYHYPRAGEIIVLGTMQPLDEAQKRSNSNLIATPERVRSFSHQLGLKYADVRLNTDDNLLTEYALPPRLYLSESLIDENLKSILSDK